MAHPHQGTSLSKPLTCTKLDVSAETLTTLYTGDEGELNDKWQCDNTRIAKLTQEKSQLKTTNAR